ncbi:MAG TPA: coenzyme F420-0:L-glutamate ligase [candidate division Zixibacteria bacterium]|nr:coenzyme F420-0:L-glutamate ligase [candidate division Zixibacteria bacterium]
MIEIIPVKNIPIIEIGDNISKIILDCLNKNKLSIKENDVFIIAQSIISRAEGEIIHLNNIEPSDFAIEIAKQSNKDPRHVEIILKEAKNICKYRNGVLVTETKHGFVCANSGVDKSNVSNEEAVSLLPKNPDKSAKEIREYLEKKTKKKIAVIISDTHNRPFRIGAINIAIGCSGINPLLSYVNKKDLFGYELKSSVISVADQLCSAAGLEMGEADEGFPIILIRGYNFSRKEISAKELIRPVEKDYFR